MAAKKGRQSGILEVIFARFWSNCAIWYKSMKIGMMVENFMLNHSKMGTIFAFSIYGGHLGNSKWPPFLALKY